MMRQTGGVGRRGNLHQVEPFLLRNGERLRRRHDAQLLPGVVNHTNFPNADAFVHSYAIVPAGSSVESDKASYALRGYAG
ncbi:MAG: hypothetical protein QM736_05640 [Vicinamibacterales bacterium]